MGAGNDAMQALATREEDWPDNFSGDDLAAIWNVLRSQREIQLRGNAIELRGLYADDLHWMNAFGSRLIGRDEVIKYLAALWATPGFRARRELSNEVNDIWFINCDIVVVHCFHTVEGQRTLEGQMLSRRTHSEKIFVRSQGGWVIKSEIFADERDQKQRLISRTAKAGDEIRPLTVEDINIL